MAPSRKALEQANAVLTAQVEACSQHSPYIPLAEEISARAAAEAAAVPAGNLEQQMDAIVADLTAEEKRNLLLTEFHKLPAETRLSSLVAHFGDAAIKEALAHERELLVHQDEKQKAIQRIYREAVHTNKIDLAAVPRDAHVSIALYHKPDMYNTMSAAELGRSQTVQWMRQLVGVSRGGGSFIISSDMVNKGFLQKNYSHLAFYDQPELEDRVVYLGGNLDLPEDERHAIYFRGGLSAQIASHRRTVMLRMRAIRRDDTATQKQVIGVPLGVGYCSVGGVVILGDRNRNQQ